MLAAAATVASLCELQAKAKALSARANTRPPWQTPWPLTMSARTRITTRAHPGRTASMRMPSACEARSRAYSAAAACSARRCAASRSGAGSWFTCIPRAQRPVKCGVRLAAKAATPSA